MISPSAALLDLVDDGLDGGANIGLAGGGGHRRFLQAGDGHQPRILLVLGVVGQVVAH
jgi:hypothetical protein